MATVREELLNVYHAAQRVGLRPVDLRERLLREQVVHLEGLGTRWRLELRMTDLVAMQEASHG